MGENSLPMTVTRQRRGCDLNPGPSAPESSTLTTRLPSHPPATRKTKNQKTDMLRSIDKQSAGNPWDQSLRLPFVLGTAGSVFSSSITF